MRKAFWVATLILFMVGSASALVVKLDVPTLSKVCDDVLMGQVTSLESRWQDDEGYIYTYVTVEVATSLKGVITEPVVTVKVPGGEANGMVLMVSDIPQFDVGQKVVLFADGNEDGTLDVVGGFQGKYTVVGDRVQETGQSLDRLLNEVRTSLSVN